MGIVMKSLLFFARTIFVLSWCFVFNVSGMHSVFKYIILKDGGQRRGNILDLWAIRANRQEYKLLRQNFLYYIHPDRQDSHMLNALLNHRIDHEKSDNPDVPKLLAVCLSRMKPESFVALVNMHTHNSLWKKSYAWDGDVYHTFFKNIDLLSQDKVYEILGLMVRYNPQHFALYSWCNKDLDRAYDYIGYDGLKKLYDAAFEHEKVDMEDAYRLVQRELYRKDRPLYFLDEVIKFKDWEQSCFN
jgi:hypothetical protein